MLIDICYIIDISNIIILLLISFDNIIRVINVEQYQMYDVL